MLKVQKVEKAERKYLGFRKFNPLSKIFNVVVLCEKDEKLTGTLHVGADFEESVKKGKNYTLLVEQKNFLNRDTPECGDITSLHQLEKNENLRVLESDFLIKFS